jgi:2-keto-4-pentenoate hydratase/2-oxohepta-3-ene-1,7-dioic acid hydratase in catechol pathway
MRLVTVVHNGTRRLGALRTQHTVVDLNRADPRLPADMLEFLEGGEAAIQRARAALDQARQELDLSTVRLTAPLPRPGKIICVGLNYRDHAEETHQTIPDYPTIFSKYTSCVIGPDEPIVIPRVSDEIDYEGELGVVIGQRVRHVPQERALEVVAGYLPFNDVSARDYQRRTSQWLMGKTFDTFGPMGPALVTADEVPDPHNLDIRVTVSGQVLQASNTRHLIFSVPYLIAYLSQVMTLEPGDVLSTGTPGGVGFARTPPRYLRPGDIVNVEIESLGTLTNPVVAEA